MDSASFYEACLLQLRSYHSRRDTPSGMMTSKPPPPLYDNDLYAILDTMMWEQQRNQSPNNQSSDFVNERLHLFTSTEVSDEDLGLVCGVAWAYGKICAYRNKDIIPEETTLCGELKLCYAVS